MLNLALQLNARKSLLNLKFGSGTSGGPPLGYQRGYLCSTFISSCGVIGVTGEVWFYINTAVVSTYVLSWDGNF